jgi:cysteine synthase
MVAAAKGYGAVLAMPASIAQEKIDAMQTFGAQVLLTPSVPFTSPEHYFHRAREGAAALGHHLGHHLGHLLGPVPTNLGVSKPGPVHPR